MSDWDDLVANNPDLQALNPDWGQVSKPPKRRPGKSGASRSHLEAKFRLMLRSFWPDLLLIVTEEYDFHPERNWCFDFAFVEAKVAIECDGGQWQSHGGRHARDSDREKLNEAAVLGWRVLRFSGAMLDDPDACLGTIRRALK